MTAPGQEASRVGDRSTERLLAAGAGQRPLYLKEGDGLAARRRCVAQVQVVETGRGLCPLEGYPLYDVGSVIAWTTRLRDQRGQVGRRDAGLERYASAAGRDD